MFQLRAEEHQYVIDFIDAVADSARMREWLLRLEEIPGKIRATHLQQVRDEMRDNDEPESFVHIVDLLHDDRVLFSMNRVVSEVLTSGMKTQDCLTGKADILKKFNLLVVLLNV